MGPEWMSAQEVADRLGISVSAVHRLHWRGTLAAVRVGWYRFFRRDVVEALAADGGYRRRSRRKKTMKEMEEAGQITLGRDVVNDATKREDADG